MNGLTKRQIESVEKRLSQITRELLFIAHETGSVISLTALNQRSCDVFIHTDPTHMIGGRYSKEKGFEGLFSKEPIYIPVDFPEGDAYEKNP